MIFRIGTLFWTVGILVGIYWCFGNWGFWDGRDKYFGVKFVYFYGCFLVDFQNKKTEYFLVSVYVNYPCTIGKKNRPFLGFMPPGYALKSPGKFLFYRGIALAFLAPLW